MNSPIATAACRSRRFTYTRDPTAASRVPVPVTPTLDSTPHARARGLKLASPNEFDGDRLKGRAFLIHADFILPSGKGVVKME